MMEKQGKSYRPRRNLSDKEIQRGLDEWAQKKAAYGLDPDFWRYLMESPDGFASIDGFKPTLERLEFSAHWLAIKAAKAAAKQTLPQFADRFGPRTFDQRHLLTAFAFRLFLDKSPASIMAHLNRHFPFRFAVFERSRRIPNWSTLYRFEQNLPPQDFQRFLDNLRPLNAAMCDLIELRLEMRVSSD